MLPVLYLVAATLVAGVRMGSDIGPVVAEISNQ